MDAFTYEIVSFLSEFLSQLAILIYFVFQMDASFSSHVTLCQHALTLKIRFPCPPGTTIKHPYQLQMSGRDEDSEDDTYMGYHYTTCPDCERDIPNEPTKKEFAEMTK